MALPVWPDPGPRRPGARLLLLLLVSLLALGVAVAGFVTVRSAGRTVAGGDYSESFQLAQNSWSEKLGVCLKVELSGSVHGTWDKPSWSLRGPGWKSVQTYGTEALVTTWDGCVGGDAEKPVDTLRLTQYWATETCARPVSDSWQIPSTRTLDCPAEQVAAYQGVTGDGSVYEPDPRSPAVLSTVPRLRWDGTTAENTFCVRVRIEGEIGLDGRTDDVVLDGYRVCLDAD